MTVPLCPFHHRQLHDDGEEVWAATYGGLRIQWLAGALWASSGDYAKACQAIGMARS